MVFPPTDPSRTTSLSTRIGGVSPAFRLRVALAASLCAGAIVACQGADPYYRNRPDAGSGLSGLGGAGAAGTFGFAATSGAAGSGNSGGSIGSPGAAGTMLGPAGSSGAAGSTGAAGSPTGAAGSTGAAGAGGSAGMLAMPCTTCMVKLQYTCRSNGTGQASFVLDVTNESSVSFPLSSLTLRYWYTIEAGKPQELDCDYAKVGCTNLVTSADASPTPKFVPVTPMKDMANEYAEIAFKASALALDPFLDTGEIQLRLRNVDYSPITQTDDYSFDAMNCAALPPTAVEWSKITAYLDGVLVWGTEPGPPQ
jgi:hypothetical protein